MVDERGVGVVASKAGKSRARLAGTGLVWLGGLLVVVRGCGGPGERRAWPMGSSVRSKERLPGRAVSSPVRSVDRHSSQRLRLRDRARNLNSNLFSCLRSFSGIWKLSITYEPVRMALCGAPSPVTFPMTRRAVANLLFSLVARSCGPAVGLKCLLSSSVAGYQHISRLLCQRWPSTLSMPIGDTCASSFRCSSLRLHTLGRLSASPATQVCFTANRLCPPRPPSTTLRTTGKKVKVRDARIAGCSRRGVRMSGSPPRQRSFLGRAR